MSSLLENKTILIMGIRNKWSIAWGIAKAAREEGANLIFTYLGDREKESVTDLAASIGVSELYQCDISSDEDINKVFTQLKEKYGVIHGVVHAIAYAKAEDLQKDFIHTSRDGFALAMDISAYSLVAVSRAARELMTEGGSILTLTYMGSERVFPGYNMMGVAKAALEASVRYLAHDLGPAGIRVNAISAGPIKTMSAKGVGNFSTILDVVEEKAPLRKRVELDELGDASVYLLSRLSRGTTGEILYVDGGYNIMGL